MDQQPQSRTIFWVCDLLILVLLAYSNHFQNDFHFDDSHTVQQNPYIRDLRNIPRFFADGRTFGVLPQNRSWRPLVSTSLAIDYWIAGGLHPWAFHVSTFLWFLLQLVLMYALFQRICDRSLPDPRNRWVALFATAWYGLHPAMAETVNYIIQRGDLYDALGVVAAVWIYAARPGWRKYGIYLLPFIAGVLSKPPALIFPAILFVYVWLFEEDDSVARSEGPARFLRAFRRCIPALVTAAALAVLSAVMVPKGFRLIVPSRPAFWMTQPLVALRFFRTVFIPDALSADTDHQAVSSIWQDGAWAGFLFLALAIAAAIACGRRRQWRPAAFGLWWFVLAFLPAAALPVTEVENDHRMFFPFVGLILAVCWPVALWIYNRSERRKGLAFGVAAVCALELAFCVLATRRRNQVWRTEESLFYDATVKSPGNGRNWLNYGATQAAKGDLPRALYYLNEASRRIPNLAQIEIGLGTVYGELGQPEEAERHLRRGVWLEPNEAMSHTFYARWLEKQDRWHEALEELRIALARNPDYMEIYYLLMRSYAKREMWAAERKAAEHVLSRFPSDPDSKAYLLMAALETSGLAGADSFTKSLATPDNLLDLSTLYFWIEKFDKSAAAAAEAIKLRPNSADAYNNLASAYRKLGDWDLAIQASREALRLRPEFTLAKENLSRAEEQKRKVLAP